RAPMASCASMAISTSAIASSTTWRSRSRHSSDADEGGRMDARRVVTGHDADGKAVFVSDEMVEPVTLALLPGSEVHQLWGSDDARSFPDDGSRPEAPRYFPPVGGVRFGFFTIPPDGGQGAPPDLDVAAALAEFEAKLPGMTEYLEPAEPGMHTTDTLDF